MKIINIEDRKIVIKGVGEAYFQDGLPIGISIEHLNDKGFEVSLFHLADEFLKHGFAKEKVISMFKEEDILTNELIGFINSEYEVSREYIFRYLFGSKEYALNWAKQNIHL